MEVDLLEGAKEGGGAVGVLVFYLNIFASFSLPLLPIGENLEVKPYKNTGNNYSSITLR